LVWNLIRVLVEFMTEDLHRAAQEALKLRLQIAAQLWIYQLISALGVARLEDV